MIIENIKETGPERFLDYNQLSVGKGEGTQEDPFLIGPSELLPKHLRIKNSAYYVHFKNCHFETLILKKCSNIKLSDCTIDSFQLEKSTKNEIENCQFNTMLSMRICIQNNIKNCFIARLDLIRSFENIIEQCKIDEAYNTSSSGNTFKNLQIPEMYVGYLLKSKLMKKILSMVIPIILLIIAISTIHLWNIDPSAAIWGISSLGSALLLVSIISYIDYRKMLKYEPNKLL